MFPENSSGDVILLSQERMDPHSDGLTKFTQKETLG